MRILVVENEVNQIRITKSVLKAGGFNPYFSGTPEEVFELAAMYDYDVVLINLSVYGSKDILMKLRNLRIKIPVVCLVDKYSADKAASLLTEGADDVISLPFHERELIARLMVAVRRSKGHFTSEIKTGPLVLNTDTKTITVKGKMVNLSEKEYRIIELLSLRKGITITEETFLNHLYGGRDEPDAKVLNVFICRLRKKLDEAGASNLIRTVWGRGYYLKDPNQAENSDDE